MTRLIKLKKKDLKDPATLMYTCEVVFDNRCEPEKVYLSKQDMTTLKNNLTAAYKKEYPNLSKKKLAYAVGVEWLNLGPNEYLKDIIKPGYALVVSDAII